MPTISETTIPETTHIVSGRIAGRLLNMPLTAFYKAAKAGEFDDCLSAGSRFHSRTPEYSVPALAKRRGSPITAGEVEAIQAFYLRSQAIARATVHERVQAKLDKQRKAPRLRQTDEQREARVS
jgi:hypothetical protein